MLLQKAWARCSWGQSKGIEDAEGAYRKRAERVADVIQLRVPDRVPIVPSFGMFPAIDNRLYLRRGHV